MTEQATAALIAEQILLEDMAAQEGVDLYQRRLREMSADPKQDLTTFAPELALLKRILPPLAKSIREFVATGVRGDKRYLAIKRHLAKLSPESIAYLTLRYAFNCGALRYSNDDFNKMQSLQFSCGQLGRQIEDQMDFADMKAQLGDTFMLTLENDLKSADRSRKQRVYRTVQRDKRTPAARFDQETAVFVGYHMLNLLVGVGNYFQVATHKRQRDFRYLEPTPWTVAWLEKHHQLMSVQFPRFRPMIMEPADWTSPWQGGYLLHTATNKSRILRSEKVMTLEALVQADLSKVYTAVNTIQRTPWRVNQRVLRVAEALLDSRLPVAGLPDRRDRKEVLATKAPKTWSLGEKPSKEQLKAWKKVASVVYEDYHRAASDRMAAVMTVDIARNYKGRERFYFPHNLDWRGRIYPIPVFLQPQGSDLAKGMLEFADSRPLGKTGYRWLKVHAANSYGIDKVPFAERIAWAEDNWQLIEAAAVDPLDDSEAFKFWTAAEHPFQFLAVCFELVESKGSSSYQSHIPVGMDGSCNGPQHLAAMGLDEEAGRLVNLVPGERSGDIYTEVAKVVAKMVEADLTSREVTSFPRTLDGKEVMIDVRTADMAALWHGKISRKTVKRPTMTTTYGATRYGFMEQLRAELGRVQGLAYLVKRIDEALRIVVKQGFAVMDYLQKVADVYCKVDGAPIIWFSPLGLPVNQDKRVTNAKRIRTFWGDIAVDLTLRKETKKINRRKMINGISPNFVHSLDSTHLMMVVNTLATQGITSIQAVHDSFGVHAGLVDEMNKVIRREFVALHKVDRLKEWRDMVLAGATPAARKAIKEIPMPERGSLDLKAVLKSDYFFA